MLVGGRTQVALELVPTLRTRLPRCLPSSPIFDKVDPEAPTPGIHSLSKEDTNTHLPMAYSPVTLMTSNITVSSGDESML